jgi:inner membrane protein
VIPDLDVVGFKFGIPYGSAFGHRGFSHSFLFAALLAGALTMWFCAKATRVSNGLIFAYLFLCTASHGLLDALTNGGHGIAFLAPLSSQRFFFPWQPIQVSPLSISKFLSGEAWPVIVSELRYVGFPSLIVGVLALFARRLRARSSTHVVH